MRWVVLGVIIEVLADRSSSYQIVGAVGIGALLFLALGVRLLWELHKAPVNQRGRGQLATGLVLIVLAAAVVVPRVVRGLPAPAAPAAPAAVARSALPGTTTSTSRPAPVPTGVPVSGDGTARSTTPEIPHCRPSTSRSSIGARAACAPATAGQPPAC
ncbi:hypothetical protein OG738_21485 [Amycolatopsis sp. NBC_01488]|uniref:hypothetical protein n=1 Tax=Amycolatopsis sp. NBC_01488 TaxID=2903563 RepID=UPI002E2BC897|nr:hypothetical protein [Amycolatopsis sp. NBC_01488]